MSRKIDKKPSCR